MPSFRRILFEARRKAIADLTPELEAAFYAAYFDALERALNGVQGEGMTEAGAREMVRRLTIALRVYAMESERAAKVTALRTIQMARDAHREALDTLARQAARQIAGNFDGVPREAFENLFMRRSMGLTDSYQSLSRTEIATIGRTIEQGLDRMVLDGESWQKAAGRVVDGLVKGDPALRAASRAFVNRSRRTRPWVFIEGDPSEEAIKAARKIGYSARMIARTEVAHAYHEGDRVSSQRSPVVAGMKWNLSPRHPKPDICDVYAGIDLHGLGAGVYPPEFLPPLPHPHDLCFMTHELRRPGEWRDAKPESAPPREASFYEVARFLGKGATDNTVASTLKQINGTSANLINTGRRAA